MKHALYLPSTPLNVLLSAAHAVEQRNVQSAELWLIDQKRVEANPYYEVLRAWPDSPFEEINLFSGTATGWQKLGERRENFQRMKQLLGSRHFSDVLVGSDRRVEFQYIMHLLSQSAQFPKGHYLDDGLYSYAGRTYHPLKDTVNAWIKNLVYGFWWQEPSTVGASSWIQDVWVMAPDLVCEQLKEKKLHRLSPSFFAAPELISLSGALLAHFGEDTEDYRHLDVVILLSHPNNLAKMPGRAEQIQTYVKAQHAAGKRIGVKYHPRVAIDDFLHLLDAGAETLFPKQLAFEFVLQFLKAGCAVVADVGTVLLTTKWLRPDLLSVAILDEQDGFQKQFVELFRTMDIEVVSNYDAIADLVGQKCESHKETV